MMTRQPISEVIAMVLLQRLLVLCCMLAIGFAPHAALAKAKKAPPKGGAEAEKKEGGAVGYGGAQVQMQPFMTPYHTTTGVRYQPLILRLTLDAGLNERPACFSIPIVHDRMVTWLFKANLTIDDFSGEKRDVLANNLFNVAVDTVGKGFYTKAEIVGEDAPEMDNKSQTLSAQCK
jgi:hypothetical protein